jgi:hypothetical protein
MFDKSILYFGNAPVFWDFGCIIFYGHILVVLFCILYTLTCL